LPFPGNGRWRSQREAAHRPLTAANNGNKSWNAGGGHKRRIAAKRRTALSWQVHWQNYGYHGCGERGKQKDVSPFQYGIKSEIARRPVRCAVRSNAKPAGDDPA
jgi:hypothetical protein